jgi:hypothetical protein
LRRAGSAYPRLPDPRYRFTAVWLDASDIRRSMLTEPAPASLRATSGQLRHHERRYGRRRDLQHELVTGGFTVATSCPRRRHRAVTTGRLTAGPQGMAADVLP